MLDACYKDSNHQRRAVTDSKHYTVQDAGITLVSFNDTYLLDMMGDGTSAGSCELCLQLPSLPTSADCAVCLRSLLSS